MPTKSTDRTVPNTFAATTDSNEPISLDEPMKIGFTAETLPSRFGGVRRLSSVERMTTLTLSTMPLISSSASDNQNHRDSANRIQQKPNAATQTNKVGPAFLRRRCTSSSEITTAPAAGAALSMPSP